MRNALLAIAVVAVGCGRGGDSNTGKPTRAPAIEGGPTPSDPVGQRTAAERACSEAIEAIVDLLQRTDTLVAATPEMARSTTCADLYIGACHEAWLALGRDPTTGVATVIDRCAAEYCDVLPAPKPAACRRDPALRDGDVLAELDGAILAHDGTAEALATALARRGKLFVPITATVQDRAPLAPHPSVMISLSRTALFVKGKPATQSELDRMVKLAIKADPQTQFVLAVDQDVPYARVVEIMNTVKASGGLRIALSTN